MLRIIESKSSGRAKSYFAAADYYSEGQELVGRWHGKGAEQLGLSGEIRQSDWDALCDNRHPQTGKTLTVRRKDNRRVGYDLNFHVPKSVSLLYAISGDERILDAFRDSVGQTMREIELEMKTRVRGGGRDEDRVTGNMVWGEYVHFTSRPVDGVPDPHLHAHCYVFNSTWDKKEGRWKAAQFGDIKRDGKYFESRFHSRLGRHLAELGVAVERNAGGWEVAGIPRTLVDKFSRRKVEIEREAKEKGITDPREKDKLGAKTRKGKEKSLSMTELRNLWTARMSNEERFLLAEKAMQIGGNPIAEDPLAAADAVERAALHCFERQSVIPERQLLAEALKRSVGKASVESVMKSASQQNWVTGERDGQQMATTREVLIEEQEAIRFARQGRGTCPRLGSADHVFQEERLNDDQRKAVLHLLTSSDRVIIVRGAAGVGKTTALREAVDAIEQRGTKVFAFANSADASRGVLREAGFANAETIATLLKDPRLQEQVKGQAILIDEAGQIGSKTMAAVFRLAEDSGSRVILVGDRRQHGSVARGSPLRLLETEAGLVPAEIKEIMRQSGDYKRAIKALSEGRTEDGFRQLDKMKWIKEVDEEDRYKMLASDYVAAVNAKKTALVVSPTHREGDLVTQEIRRRLKQAGKIDSQEHTVNILKSLDLTEEQRSDAVNYRAGDILEYHQNAKGVRRGQRVRIGDGNTQLNQSARFQAYRPTTINIAKGDVLRVTKNGYSKDREYRLNNGDLVTVRDFTESGDIVIDKGRVIAKDFGHLNFGYVVTSHASQGKSVQEVFIGQSSQSFRASSAQQFYVSASRAKKKMTVYTDQKEALLEAVRRSDDRLTATEFVTQADHRERAVILEWSKRLEPRVSQPQQPDRQREELVNER